MRTIPTLFTGVAVAAIAHAQEPTVVDSHVSEVTVYRQRAFVQRTAEVPAGATLVVLRGLPVGMDRDAVRVRCDGGIVTGVETRERLEARTPAARIADLKARVAELEAVLAAQEDESEVLIALERHVSGLFRLEERAFAGGLEGGADDDAATRMERLTWLGDQLTDLGARRRELGARRAETQRTLEDVRAQLGAADHGDGTRVVDLHVELLGSREAARLEAEYLVHDAGWTPVYDLRAPKDLSKVELVYRAEVRQGTGEDWTDVEVMLSTAEPRRGAQGPDPSLTWLDLIEPNLGGDGWFLGQGEDRARVRSFESAKKFKSAEGRRQEAAVIDSGLTVRYHLPRRETIESRRESTTVLVGREDLAVEPEHVVVPSLDTTVWLRGRTKNTSPFVLLPGRAAVYFGNDFLGAASLPAVQRGEELELHLGPDPGLLVERTLISEETEESGIFSSTETLRTRLRFRVKNNGAFTQRDDGAVDVTVHESVPRSRDERVEVEITKAEPKVARSDRFDELREERGVETWVVRVPRGGETRIDLAVEIRYPEDLVLERP